MSGMSYEMGIPDMSYEMGIPDEMKKVNFFLSHP